MTHDGSIVLVKYLVFVLYTADVVQLVEDTGFVANVYAYDLQMNLAQSAEMMLQLADCIDHVEV